MRLSFFFVAASDALELELERSESVSKASRFAFHVVETVHFLGSSQVPSVFEVCGCRGNVVVVEYLQVREFCLACLQERSIFFTHHHHQRISVEGEFCEVLETFEGVDERI